MKKRSLSMITLLFAFIMALNPISIALAKPLTSDTLMIASKNSKAYWNMNPKEFTQAYNEVADEAVKLKSYNLKKSYSRKFDDDTVMQVYLTSDGYINQVATKAYRYTENFELSTNAILRTLTQDNHDDSQKIIEDLSLLESDTYATNQKKKTIVNNIVYTLVVKDGTFRLSAVPKAQKTATTSQPTTTAQPTTAATAQPTATAQPSSAESSVVYVTASGKKYHRETCPTIQTRDVSSMTVEEAEKHGYGACKVCKP